MKEEKEMKKAQKKINNLKKDIDNIENSNSFHSYNDLIKLENLYKKISEAKDEYIYWMGQYYIKNKRKGDSDENDE